jgi:dienelactone hydrolase
MRPPFAVGLRVLTFIDRTRLVDLPGRPAEPRRLVTLIRYPAAGPPGPADERGAAPVPVGRFPLIVFGHGYAVTPGIYARLLHAWSQAGYIVAAPVFPLENADAPGGPDESDLINEPGDMSFVISRMLDLSRAQTGFLSGRIDPSRIAVAGQSDGGEAALAVTYDAPFRDRRVRAAIILSGARIPQTAPFAFPRPSPPLLATQGTADTINPPAFTDAFFSVAPPPKYELTLFGASHLGPYTDQQPQLGIVERVTIAFLRHYLGERAGLGATRALSRAGDVPGVSAIHGEG